MAGRHTERSKSRCDSVPPIPKGKLAHQIYLRARYFASRGIKTAGQGQDGIPAERVMSPRLGPCFKPVVADSGGSRARRGSFHFSEWICISQNFNDRRAQTFVPPGILT